MKEFTSKAAQVREFQFKLDGETFTAQLRSDGDAVMEWSELAATSMAGQDTDLATAEGTAFISRFFKLCMAPLEYTRFRRHMRTHHTDQDVLVDIMQGIQDEFEHLVEDTTDRPTGPPSSSRTGPTAKDARTLQLISMAQDGDIEFVEPAEAPTGPPPKRAPKKQARRAG